MIPSELAQLHGAVATLWPRRLVDPLSDEQVVFLCGALFADVPIGDALVIVQDFARQAKPFPPAWPEIREAWQARRSGVSDAPELIAAAWLSEANAAMGRRGGCFYGAMPEFSDPGIAAAVQAASGTWREWGATPNGGPGDGGAFTRNLVPERDERFRRAACSIIQHRRRTGDVLPEIMERRSRGELVRGGLRRLADRSTS